ncbi:hypothetical protein [Luteimonas aquatica]|uniref:hypothetical protein n=1 Tax=Luteimonas aquatica TaxID=450364 RepID=UPI001F56F6EB|nr:hypothetical protein [Luteimonas aquatica]
MSLQSLLEEVDPGWYRPPGADTAQTGGGRGDDLDSKLLQRSLDSELGQRMLARWLVAGAAPHLFAPRADGGTSRLASVWPRERLAALIRDLGVLAYAPAIRGEVGREPVRILKRALGNSYLLALDKAVWDGAADNAVAARLRAALHATLAACTQDDAPLYALLDHHGRHELRAWAAARDPAFADWVMLLWPREDAVPAHLPEKQVIFLTGHHEKRGGAQ